jgi:hypothetical protein
MQADDATFAANLDFIAKSHKKEKDWLITLLFFGLVFIAVGLIMVCIGKL